MYISYSDVYMNMYIIYRISDIYILYVINIICDVYNYIYMYIYTYECYDPSPRPTFSDGQPSLFWELAVSWIKGNTSSLKRTIVLFSSLFFTFQSNVFVMLYKGNSPWGISHILKGIAYPFKRITAFIVGSCFESMQCAVALKGCVNFFQTKCVSF